MKETKIFACEWAYNCPHCGNTQGWSDYSPEEREEVDGFKEPHTCDKCNKEFMVVR